MSTPFKSILCGIEGNPASTEAARQAITLAGAGADLQFTAVYTSFALGPDYHKDTLQASLEEAAKMAGEAGISASYEMREARYAIDVLLPESKEHDLLVLGTHHGSRASGLLFGSTATEAAHGAERPLLIARQPPSAEEPFTKHILLASDGSSASWEPVRAAAGLAAAFDSDLELVHVADGKNAEESVLDEQLAEIAETVGREPTVTKTEGHATKAIVEAAKDRGASLIVAGRRGLRGIKALGSVSERIVGGAECSVLLIPVGEKN